MPTITKTFLYTGTVQEVVIPAGTTSMDVSLWGGAGGGGGSDQGGPGGTGAAGHYVTASAIDLTSYIGQTLKVAVGGGGAGGQNHAGNAAGGTNGKSLTGYSGGTGGNSGPSNASGAGGGGGGATVVLIDSTEIAIAGGGGGGAGAGIASNGAVGINTNSATAATPGTLGENGALHTGDGGGGGAGGGGADGGRGGNGGSGDNGGTGGYSGSNLAAGGTENNGSGQTPGGTGDAAYQTGIARGGNPASSGANGLAVITFNIGVQAKYKASATTTNVSSSASTSQDILDYFNDILGGNPTNSNGWIIVDPPLLAPEFLGTGYYNDDIFIDENDVPLYNGSNDQDTTITIGSRTYTRGSLAASGTFVFTLGSGSYTHTIYYYNYSYTSAAGWKDITDVYTKVSGAWKQITAAYVKVAGVWKAIFNSGVNFISTAAGFGDATGNTSSGTPGSGGGGCFIAGTPITMADGTTKPVELVDLRDEVAVGGYVFATGKFIIDNLYEYKGIKVSGLHMVKEDGLWMRVMDSEHGVSLGNDEHVVYVFGSEYRRILINGIEFTDYFEISEKEELLNHGDKFFGIWQDHDRQIHEKNVKILNDGK